ncbi:hypothetical protein V5N11_033097 [Cardamine amara subsp. amara]|uniref:DUF4283 domain-containing protein n=1 Tax=Cardamine amara subsp. amara TaxID=228776 RepID=A0ABD1BNR8_CARAN
MVAMEPWHPNISNQSPMTLDFWVQIRDIPLQFLSLQMVNFIAESLGQVVETDEFGHESATVIFCYEKLRNHCFHYHYLQHDEDECEVPEEDAAMGHQDPEPEDHDINQDMLAPLHLHNDARSIQATPINVIAPASHLLALPTILREPINMTSTTVIIDG